VTAPLLIRAKKYASLSSDGREQANPSKSRDYTRTFHHYQAELLLRQLRRIDAVRERIASVVCIYSEVFRNTSAMTFVHPECDKAGLLRFPVAFPGKSRAEIVTRALKRGVSVAENYGLLPEQFEHTKFPNAAWAAHNIIQLPLYPDLSRSSSYRLAQQLLEAAEAV
jgi:dTDP-4-amino-4,6-dideoxygalactose transaminase